MSEGARLSDRLDHLPDPEPDEGLESEPAANLSGQDEMEAANENGLRVNDRRACPHDAGLADDTEAKEADAPYGEAQPHGEPEPEEEPAPEAAHGADGERLEGHDEGHDTPHAGWRFESDAARPRPLSPGENLKTPVRPAKTRARREAENASDRLHNVVREGGRAAPARPVRPRRRSPLPGILAGATAAMFAGFVGTLYFEIGRDARGSAGLPLELAAQEADLSGQAQPNAVEPANADPTTIKPSDVASAPAPTVAPAIVSPASSPAVTAFPGSRQPKTSGPVQPDAPKARPQPVRPPVEAVGMSPALPAEASAFVETPKPKAADAPAKGMVVRKSPPAIPPPTVVAQNGARLPIAEPPSEAGPLRLTPPAEPGQTAAGGQGETEKITVTAANGGDPALSAEVPISAITSPPSDAAEAPAGGDAASAKSADRLRSNVPPVAVSAGAGASQGKAASGSEIATARLDGADQAGDETQVAAGPSVSDKSELEGFVARGDELMALGDIAGARLIYAHAAENGSADAAYKMALTYDANHLASLRVEGGLADRRQALIWYGRAAEAGHAEAERRARAMLAHKQ